MLVQEETFDDVRSIFRETTTQILQKTANLAQSMLVLEFEQVFEMKLYPGWGVQITSDIHEVMAQFHQKNRL